MTTQYESFREPVRTTFSGGTVPSEVVDAIEASVVKVVRRVEIFESDGRTPWNPNSTDDPGFQRLKDGTVSVNYGSDERRTLDLTMDNEDGLLRPDFDGGLWYDKIIKVFRGVQYQGSAVAPRVVLIEATSNANVRLIRRIFSSIGFVKFDYLPGASSLSDLSDYTYVVSFLQATATARSPFLKSLWASGKNIITIGTASSHSLIPAYSNSTAVTPAKKWSISQPVTDSPARGAFTPEETATTATGALPTGLASGSVAIARSYGELGSSGFTAALATHANGARWFDLHMPVIGEQSQKLMRAVLNYMRGYSSRIIWETQMGEFMIDNISEDNFPSEVKVTGRDYTKKMLLSKLGQTSTFVIGTRLRDLVIGLAASSGVDTTRIKVSIGNETLSSDMSFDRGTDRWSIAKGACEAYGYEIFFNAFGELVVRKFIDPTTGQTSWTFKTGYEEDASGANLVKYNRAVNDSNIYNHIIVTSDPSGDEDRLPYFGEAKNEDPTSPTRIQILGPRTLPVDTGWLGSDAECVQYAVDRLKITALESYEISFESIYYPWLECGEIDEVLDPDRYDFEPTRFLIDSITYPLALGNMSATGKRITFVGSAGTPETI